MNDDALELSPEMLQALPAAARAFIERQTQALAEHRSLIASKDRHEAMTLPLEYQNASLDSSDSSSTLATTQALPQPTWRGTWWSGCFTHFAGG